MENLVTWCPPARVRTIQHEEQHQGIRHKAYELFNGSHCVNCNKIVFIPGRLWRLWRKRLSRIAARTLPKGHGLETPGVQGCWVYFFLMKDKLWHEWFRKEKERLLGSPSRPPKRHYIHLDNRISSLDENMTRALLAPEQVAKHTFYPFIRMDTREKRYRRAPDGSRRRIKSTKKRPIDYAAHKDSLVYSWYAAYLTERYERELVSRGISPNVIAYRSIRDPGKSTGKSNVDFAKEALDFIEQNAPCDILAIDVSKFFQEINHDILKRQWANLLGTSLLPADHFHVFSGITRFKFVRSGRIRALISEARIKRRPRICTPVEFKVRIIANRLQEIGGKHGNGIPQGAPISCVLANLYMIDFDTALAGKVGGLGGFYTRYSDDILLVVPPGHAEEVGQVVSLELMKLALTIKEEKTERMLAIRNADEIQFVDSNKAKASFRYLGIESDGATPRIRHGSLARFQRKLNRTARRAVINAASKERSGAPKKYLHSRFGKPRNNFLAYAQRASERMKSPEIARQVSVTREARRVKKKILDVSKRIGDFTNS